MIKLFIARLKNKLNRRFAARSRQVDGYAYGSAGSTTKRAYGRRMFISDDLKRQAAFFFAFLAVGSVIGAIVASMLGYSSFGGLFRNIDEYIHNGIAHGTARGIIIESLVKHGKIIVCIWLLGFTPRFAPLCLLVVLVQGIGLGFTTAILTRGFGINGILYATVLYLPQNLILIPAYFYVTTAALKRGKSQESSGTAEYVLRLVPALAIAAVVSCFEWVITPALLGFVA